MKQNHGSVKYDIRWCTRLKVVNHVITEQVTKGNECLPKDRHFVFLVVIEHAQKEMS